MDHQFTPFVTALLVVGLCVGAPLLAYFVSGPIEWIVRDPMRKFMKDLWELSAPGQLYSSPTDVLLITTKEQAWNMLRAQQRFMENPVVGMETLDITESMQARPLAPSPVIQQSESVAVESAAKKKNAGSTATATSLPKAPVKGMKKSAPRAGTQKSGPKPSNKRGKKSK